MRNWPFIYFLIVSLFANCVTGFSQADFEGTIDFKMQNKLELVGYTYFVKGDKVKIDQLNLKTKKLEKSFIVNLKTEHMIAVNHDDKIWTEYIPTVITTPPGKTEVIKTDNTQLIQGYNCTEYIVKNKVDAVNLSYWVAVDKFEFFTRVLRIMNRREKFALYYLQLPDIKGMFPLLAIMSPITKMEKERLEVTKIEAIPIELKTFDVPSGYLKLED